MCSIAAYVGGAAATPEIVESLSHMTYRGYDSAGMAVWDGSRTHTRKVIGTDLSGVKLPGSSGVGQTRWATHGANDLVNANPQTSGDRVAVVMNGTITNYDDLRTKLEGRGYKFVSDNDTEALAHLADMLRGDLHGITNMVEGRFSTIIIYHGRVGCIRRGPSLSVGKTETATYVASDVAAFSARADMVYNLPANSYAYVDATTCRPYDGNGRPMKFTCERVAPEVSAPRADTSISHTEAELLECSRLLAGLECDWIIPEGEVVITGSGSSYHVALLAELLMRQRGRRVTVFPACEYRSYPPPKSSTLVAISQSGETGDVLRAVESYTGTAGIVALTNNQQSSLAALADRTVPLECGPEIGVAATKSFMVQAGMVMAATGAPYGGGKMPDPDCIPSLVVEAVAGAPDVYILGSGIHYIAALEGALKLKELVYVHAEAMYAGEFKHGPLATLERGTPVIILGDAGDTTREIMARGGYVIAVSGGTVPVCNDHIVLDASGGQRETFLREVWVLQMLAVRAALAANRNVDRPRHLAKSVTV